MTDRTKFSAIRPTSDIVKAVLLSLPLMLAGIGDASRSVFIGVVGIGASQLLVAMMLANERTIPALISKRGGVRVGWILIALLFASLAGLYSWQLTGRVAAVPAIEDQFAQSLFGFVAMGGVLGAVFRHCCGRLAFKTIVGKRSLEAAVSVSYVWTLAVFMYPNTPLHVDFGLYYVLGFAGGVLVHSANRQQSRKAARYRRRVSNLFMGMEANEPITKREDQALSQLAKGKRIRSLLDRMEQWKLESQVGGEKWTERLEIIKYSAHRLIGDYEVTGDLPSKESDAYTFLALIQALNRADLGKDAEARRMIEDLLATERGSKCAAVNATKALLMAEEVCEYLDATVHDLEPIELMNKALVLRTYAVYAGAAGATLGSRAMGVGVPVTSTLMRDVSGYCLLAAGLLAEGRGYFVGCIEDDPDYSAAYLHLGDFFLLSARIKHDVAKDGRADEWHARLCYRTAEFLEGKLPSKTRRQALKRLRDLDAGIPFSLRLETLTLTTGSGGHLARRSKLLEARAAEIRAQSGEGGPNPAAERELKRIEEVLGHTP